MGVGWGASCCIRTNCLPTLADKDVSILGLRVYHQDYEFGGLPGCSG